MLNDPSHAPDTPNLNSAMHPVEEPVTQPEPASEVAAQSPTPNAQPSAGETVPLPGAEALVAPAQAALPASGLDAQIQQLKSEVPNIGVLGVTEKLSDSEYLKLLTYEEVVAMANNSWFEAGRALARIQEEELWRANYSGFNEYCAARWQFCRSKVYYLMGAASVYDTLRSVPDLPKPEFESQLHALISLEPEKRIEAWQRAARRAGNRRITAAIVQAATKAVRAPAGPEKSPQAERRREQIERRHQFRERMRQLLEGIMARRPYEELTQKAAVLDREALFFFPPPRKR